MSTSLNQPRIGVPGRQYGLQLTKTSSKNSVLKPRLGIFQENDNNNETKTPLNLPIQPNINQIKKVKEMQDNLIKEDPNVFAYDEVYDNLQDTKKYKLDLIKEEKKLRKPKYMNDILQRTDERKIEQAMTYERVCIKERVKEDHLYQDKEKFVTSSYKKALIERNLFQKKLDAEKIKEKQNDVLKKEDIHSGQFFSNLLNNISSSNSETIPSSSSTSHINSTSNSNLQESQSKPPLHDDPSSVESSSISSHPKPKQTPNVVFLPSYSAKIFSPNPSPSSQEVSVPSSPPDSQMTRPSITPHRQNSEESIKFAKERYLQRKRKHMNESST